MDGMPHLAVMGGDNKNYTAEISDIVEWARSYIDEDKEKAEGNEVILEAVKTAGATLDEFVNK